MSARITRETQSLAKELPEGVISAVPHETNFRHFLIKMAGPPSSPYAGGVFNLELYLPEDYPISPPKVLFRTKIYHPNIDFLGRFYCRFLKKEENGWSPIFMIYTVLI